MNIAQIMALSVVAVVSVVAYFLMRYPQTRRPQFQGGRAFSAGVALACALGLFVVFALLLWWLR